MKKKLNVGMVLVGLMLVGVLSFAGLTDFPRGITSFGIPVLGSGGFTTTGSVFFVDSTTGSNGNSGTDPEQPLATIEYALESRVTADKGDIVIVMPGHSETVTSAIAWSAGMVTLKGIGPAPGCQNLTTATADINLMDVTGDYCTIENLRFTNTATMTAVTEMIDVATTGLMIRNCVFDFDSSASVAGIDLLGTGGLSDNTVEQCVFIRPSGASTTTGQGTGILHSAARTTVNNCVFDLTNGGTPLAMEQTAAASLASGIGYGVTFSNNLFKCDGSATPVLSWNATVGEGHAIVENLVLDQALATGVFGSDTGLDTQLIMNYQGAGSGTRGAIDPSP